MGFEFCPVSVFADRELPEHGEIDDPALGLGGEVVGALVVVQQVEGFFERGGDVVDLVLGRVGPVLDLGSFVSDPGLFGPEHFFRDAVAVVELDQLLLLGGQVAQAPGVALALCPGDVGSFLNERTEAAPDQVALFEREPLLGVNKVKLGFDPAQLDVAGAAAAVGRDTTQAGVVLVVNALLAAVAAIGVTFAAAATDQVAGQVVVVLAAAAAAGAVTVEGDLGAIERLLGNQRIVATADLDVAVGDDADVVVVTEHAVDGRQVERLGRAGRRGAGAQAGVVEDLGDRADGVQTGGGEVERQPDQSGAFRVDGDARDLTVLDRLADVEVAKAGGAERAAFEVLALHAEADLLAVVARAEGVDAAHDGVVEHALGAGVNVLLGRFKLAAKRRDLAKQPEGVELVAGDAGQVVEDDVVGSQVAQLGQHALQRRAIGRAGRLAGLDELGDHLGAERPGVASADVALGREGVALAVDGGVDLPDRRDPQVDDSRLGVGAWGVGAHDRVSGWLWSGGRQRGVGSSSPSWLSRTSMARRETS